MEEQISSPWRKLNVKQEQKRRLRLSRLAKQHARAVQGRHSPLGNHSPGTRAMQGYSKLLSPSQKSYHSSMEYQSPRGWHNPDLSTLKNTQLHNLINHSGEIELMRRTHINQAKISSEQSPREGMRNSRQPMTQLLAPDSIQIVLKPKQFNDFKPQFQLAPPPAFKLIDSCSLRNEILETEENDQSSLAKHASSQIYADFAQVASQEQRQTLMLGTNDDKKSGSDMLLLAEKYLQSSKQITEKNHQTSLEQQVFQAHRDAQVSRISSSAVADDLVLVGGRITAGSGFTNLPISSAGKDSVDGIEVARQTAQTATKEAGKSMNIKNKDNIPATAATVKQQTARQIVVQKKHDSMKICVQNSVPARQGSLLKSVQDHVFDTGFIYSLKNDNLTISKDILYEESSSPDLNKAIRALQKNRRDSNKHAALKELLKSRGADHILKGKSRYHEQLFVQACQEASHRVPKQNFRFEFQSMSPRMSMQPQTTFNQDQIPLGRNHPISRSFNKPYNSVRGSVHQNENDSTRIPEFAAANRQPKIPQIIKQIDQRQRDLLSNRLVTARNTTLDVSNQAYGTLTGYLISNRHIRTNQQHQRNGQSVLKNKLASDFISLQEDGNGSDAIKTLAGGESVTSTLKAPAYKSQDDGKSRVGAVDGHRKSQAAPLSLEIVHSESQTGAAQVSQASKASAEIARLKNVYNGLMPLSNSSNQMGVSIRSQPTQKSNVKVADEGEEGFSTALGKTYMNSFMGRHARQSPVKVRDAEKAFLQKEKRQKTLRKPREVSPLGIHVAKMSALAQEHFDETRNFEESAYRTLSYMSWIRPDSIRPDSITLGSSKASPQTQWNQSQQKQQAVVPLPSSTTNRVSLTLASKFFSAKQQPGQKQYPYYDQHTESQRNSSQAETSFKGQDSLRLWESRPQVHKKDSFFLETRMEQLRITEQLLIQELNEKKGKQQNQQHQKILLNQPSQELDTKQCQTVSRVSRQSSPSPPVEWRQVPLQHRDSSSWPAQIQSQAPSPKPAQETMRITQQKMTEASRGKGSASPNRANYRGNEVRQKQNSVIRIAQQRGSSQLRTTSGSLIQGQWAPDGSINTKMADWAQQRIANSQAQAAFSQKLKEPSSATIRGGVFNRKNQNMKRKDPDNRRTVGGKKTNQVGTLHKGATPKLLKKDSTENPQQSSRKKIGRTGSQLGMEASKQLLDERRREYEQKQETHFDDAIRVMMIKQISKENLETDSEKQRVITKEASFSSVSKTSMNSVRQTYISSKKTSNYQMKHSPRYSHRKPLKKASQKAQYQIALVIDGTKNAPQYIGTGGDFQEERGYMNTAPATELKITDPGTSLKITELGQRSADKEKHLSEEEIMITCNEDASHGHISPDRQSSRSPTKQYSETTRQHIESALKNKKKPNKKETLTLINQPFAEVLQRKLNMPKVQVSDKPKKELAGSPAQLLCKRRDHLRHISSPQLQLSQHRVSPILNSINPGGAAISNPSQTPNIIIGGSQIQMSQQRLYQLPKVESIVNNDLQNVLVTSKSSSSKNHR